MGSRALAVTMYTVLELSRRRVLAVFVAIGILLTAGLGLAPLVVPGAPPGEERTLFVLQALSGAVSFAIQLCAFGVGMTVINHDLDSGAVVGIFAKPISRLGYAGGKLLAAVVVLVLLDAVFAAGTIALVALNGGGHTGVLIAFFAATAANVGLLMILVMLLTVYLNNVVAAVLVFVFSFVNGIVLQLHVLAQRRALPAGFWTSTVNFVYWVFPHQLLSNLQRDIVATSLRLHPMPSHPPGVRGGAIESPLSRVPGASGPADIAIWAGYVALICALYYLALRRKQV